MHDGRAKELGCVESSIEKSVPDTFFDAACRDPVPKDELVVMAQRTLVQFCACMHSVAFHVVVIDTYPAPPAPTLRCNHVMCFQGCRNSVRNSAVVKRSR